MRAIAWAAVIATLACCAGAEVAPEKLAAFRLSGSRLLRGFVRAQPDPRTVPPAVSQPAGAVAALNERWFHGSTELRWTVTLHRSTADANRWVLALRTTRSLATPYSPAGRIEPSATSWHSTAADQAELKRRTSRLRSNPTAQMRVVREIALRDPLSVFAGTTVGPVVIEVWGFQHPEARRRDPSAYRRALPGKGLAPLVKAVAEELVRRARREARTVPWRDRHVTLRLRDVPLWDALPRALGGANYVLRLDEAGADPVGCDLDQIPASDVLRHLLAASPHRLLAEECAGIVVIRPAIAGPLPASYPQVQVACRFDRADVRGALGALFQACAIRYRFGPEVRGTVSSSADRGQWRTVFEKCLREAAVPQDVALTYRVEDGVWSVVSKAVSLPETW